MDIYIIPELILAIDATFYFINTESFYVIMVFEDYVMPNPNRKCNA